MRSMGILVLVWAACSQGQQVPALETAQAKDLRLAQRLLDAMDANDRWRRYWTLETARRSDVQVRAAAEVSLTVTEAPSLAGLCIVETGGCGLFGWSSGGHPHLLLSTQIATQDAKQALEESTRLVSGQMFPPDRVVAGDMSKPSSLSVKTYRRFAVRTKRSGPGSYAEANLRGSFPDDLVQVARRQADGFRISCGAGRLSLPFTTEGDPYAYVLAELGDPCGRGFFLWRKNELNSWTFERFIVGSRDVEFLMPKFRQLKQTVITLPRVVP